MVTYDLKTDLVTSYCDCIELESEVSPIPKSLEIYTK